MRLIYLLLISLSSFLLSAQSISVATSATDVFAKQPFDITYTIEDPRNVQFTAPDFSPFSILAGPFTSSNISIVNGARTESKAYTYRLKIDKAGSYKIPAAIINTGSYKKRSKELKINVLQATKENSMEGDRLQLEMNLSDSIVYVGQQLLIDHDLYYGNLDVKGASLVGNFPRDRFIVNQVKSGSNIRKSQLVYEGKMQNKANICRLALFPLRSGEMTVPDINFEIDIQKANARKRRGFFSFNTYDSRIVKTSEFTIDIQALPPNPPASFTGNVGTLEAKSGINTKALGVGEEIFVTFQLSGNGLADQINAPEWEQKGFQIFDPKLVKDDARVTNGQIVFTKNFRYLVIPEEQGQFTLNIPFSYFDPQKGEYVSKTARISNITVSESANKLTDATEKNILSVQNQIDVPWYKRPWIWASFALLAAFGFLFYVKRKKARNAIQHIEPEEASRIIAQQKLSSAKVLLDKEETSKYWETLENALRIYLEEKLEIGTSQYSIAQISEKWQENNFEQNYLEVWKEMVNKINLARYAGQSISNMENLFKEALDWIISVENQYPSE